MDLIIAERSRRIFLTFLAIPLFLTGCPNEKNGVQTAKGIAVGQPKIYDDGTLETMLAAARQQLAAVQFLNQAEITANLNSLQGASSRQSAINLQVQGPPAPQVVTTNNSTGPGAPSTTQVVTTQAAANASIPALTTGGSPAMPSTFAPSATNTLNQQMQLTYEVMNLQLMLEGSLNDRFTNPFAGQRAKQTATIGFEVSIDDPADSLYDNAVAEVLVQVARAPNETKTKAETGEQTELTKDSDPPPESPGIMNILPREKTYNEALITDKSSGFGLGVVTQVFSIGAAGSKRNQTYRLVQDYDTIAFVREPPDSNSVLFGWQFRPTLGQRRVTPGLRQVFVQLSFPADKPIITPALGTITVTAHWRRFDPRTGSVGDPILASPTETKRHTSKLYSSSNMTAAVLSSLAKIPNFDLTPELAGVSWADSGTGQLIVEAPGNYLDGSYIQVGGTTLKDGTPGFSLDRHRIRFTLSAATLLIAGAAYIVGPQGDELAIEKTASDKAHLQITGIRRTLLSPAEYLVEVDYKDAYPGLNPSTLTPLVLVGGTVFGLSDHPIDLEPTGCLAKGACTIRFHATADLLESGPEIKVAQPFYGPHGQDSIHFNAGSNLAETSVSLMAKSTDCSLLAIQGSGFNQSTSVSVAGFELPSRSSGGCDFTKTQPNTAVKKQNSTSCSGKANTTPKPAAPSQCDAKDGYADLSLEPSTILVAIPNCLLTNLKEIELSRKTESAIQSIIVALPQDKPAPVPTLNDATVKIGDANFKVTGTNVNLIDAKSVSCNGSPLAAYKSQDGSYLIVAAAPCIPQVPGFYPISMKTMDGKTTVTVLIQVTKGGS